MRPVFKITVNGSDITSKISDRLLSLTLTDEAGVNSDRIELVLDDRDERLEIPPMRATMDVQLGYSDRLVPKGAYTIEEVQITGAERRMTLRGTAVGASKGAGASREASWDDTTIGDIARSIAARHGWAPAINQEIGAIKIQHADQHENDMMFLSRLAAENGAVAKVAGGSADLTHFKEGVTMKLIVAPHAEAKTATGKYMPTIDIVAQDVSSWAWTSAERGDYSGVKAMWHDQKSGQRGSAIVGADDVNTHSLPHTYATHAAAERAAQAKMKALKRGKAKLDIDTMPGNPMLAAECRANVSGFRKGIDGVWTVIRAQHRLTDSGYTCALECETPETGKAAAK